MRVSRSVSNKDRVLERLLNPVTHERGVLHHVLILEYRTRVWFHQQAQSGRGRNVVVQPLTQTSFIVSQVPSVQDYLQIP